MVVYTCVASLSSVGSLVYNKPIFCTYPTEGDEDVYYYGGRSAAKLSQDPIEGSVFLGILVPNTNAIVNTNKRIRSVGVQLVRLHFYGPVDICWSKDGNRPYSADSVTPINRVPLIGDTVYTDVDNGRIRVGICVGEEYNTKTAGKIRVAMQPPYIVEKKEEV